MKLTDIEEVIMQNVVKRTEYQKMGDKTMICLLTANNGFEVVGHASCLDPLMFNEDIGKELALKNALEKLGEHHAYTLQDKIQG
ncbi:hypothetical protein [Bacillus phage YungSlug]|nr:hypothetical protein [Bacillus phage YungSlug]